MKVIALVNQKGGVAKTTTAASLSWGLAKKGKKVLAIDFDPQGNLSSAMGAELKPGTPTAYEWIGCDTARVAAFRNVVQHCGGVDLIPATIALSQAELYISQRLNRERVLDKAIGNVPKNMYDYIIIDSPPSLGMLTINILTAADEVIVPLKPEWYSYEGARTLRDTLGTMREEVNPRLRIKGYLLTMHDKRRNVGDIVELITELAASVGSKVFGQAIRLNVAAADAPSYATSIYDYKPDSAAAQDYLKFVDEFLEDEKNGN